MKNILTIKRCRICIILLFSIINCININGQTVLDYTPTTPDIGSIIQAVNMPMNLYQGLPDIHIPIHEIKLRNFSLPIYLSYNAGGNKPDLYTGSVGLGWNLYAGGQIYRTINGYSDISVGTFSEYLSRVQMQNWDKTDNLSRYYNPVTTNKDLRKEPDLDEFIINMGPISGSFYIYKDDKGEIQTKISSKSNTNFRVKNVEIKKFEDKLLESVIFYGRTIKYFVSFFNDIVEFTLVDFNGIEYTFGGDDLNYFDYSCYKTDPGDGNIYYQATTSAWKINSIKNPNGETIKFEYSKEEGYGDYYTTYQTYDYSISSTNVIGQRIEYTTKYSWGDMPDERGYSSSNLYTSYLKTISSSKGDYIIFDISKRNDLFPSVMYTPNRPKKIDRININNNWYVKFEYIDKPESRLRLTSLDFNNLRDETYKYKFEYNPLSLPHYHTRQTDNWGYYNGKSYQTLIENDKHDDLYNFRQADTLKSKAEILQKIIYPTGGEVNFDYESHTYSKIAKKYPFEITSENGITGGLRIKSIRIVNPIDPTQNIVKKYYYLNEDNSSSGILSHMPKYTARGNGTVDTYLGSTHIKGTFSYTYKSENHINWFADNHISYSRVIEELSDGSRTIYQYSNFDTDNDEEACGVFSPELGDDLHYNYTSKELSRGLLQNLKIYDNLNHIKKEISYLYNSNDSNYLKVINRYAFANNIPIRITANKIYTYHPYLEVQKTVDYLNNSTVSTIKKYTYNDRRLLSSETFQNGDGRSVEKQYIYVSDFADSYNFIDPYSILLNKSIIANPIEYIMLIDGKEIHRIKRNYTTKTEILKLGLGPLLGFIPLPLNIEESFSGANNLKEIKSYQHFDSYQNPTECIDKEGVKIFYLWSYLGQHPIAEIKNTTYTYAEIENIVKSVFSVTSIDGLSRLVTPNEIKLKDSSLQMAFPQAQVTTYTYQPLVGVLTATDPREVTTHYEYDTFGRLKATYIQEKGSSVKKLLQSYDYHYQNQ